MLNLVLYLYLYEAKHYYAELLSVPVVLTALAVIQGTVLMSE